MKTIEFKAYTINEIENEYSKNKIMEEYREKIIEGNFDILEYQLQDILREKYNIKNAELYYSLSYSQGDGLRFESEDILSSNYFMDLVKTQLSKSEKTQLSKMLRKYYINFKSVHGGHHLYEYCTEYDIVSNYDNYNLTEKQQQLIEKIENIIASEYVKICKELEHIGYNCYDVSDNDVLDYLDDNEIEFANINGSYIEI